MDGGFAGALGPAHRLAVEGDHAGRNAGQRDDPGDEATLDLVGVQHRQDVAQVTVVRRAILERTEAAKKRQLFNPEQGDLGESFGTGKHAEQAQEQDLIERVGHLALLARVVQIFEMTQKDDRFVECAAVRYCTVHCRSPFSESRIGIDSAL